MNDHLTSDCTSLVIIRVGNGAFLIAPFVRVRISNGSAFTVTLVGIWIRNGTFFIATLVSVRVCDGAVVDLSPIRVWIGNRSILGFCNSLLDRSWGSM